KTFFGKVILKFEAALSEFTHWISNLLKWSLKSWKTKLTTLGIAVLMFFGSITLVGAGFVGGEFFPAIDRGEFLVQIELPKDAAIEQTNILTQKAEKFLEAKPEIVDLITMVGQVSSGFGATQATSYQSEISVILNDKSLRSDNTFIYAAKIKRELQNELVNAKIATIPVGLMGAEQAPLQLIVVGSDL